jgi:hypothetical protein
LKKRINIKYQNGINKQIAETEIFSELLNEYEFIESTEPEFILFGPYGNDIPQTGNYIRIGYFSENMKKTSTTLTIKGYNGTALTLKN